MIPYFDRQLPDSSGITIEKYDSVRQISYLDKDNFVPMHRHHFYEMVFVQRGTCRHFYKNDVTLLIPGDLFLVSPDEPHSYQFDDTIKMYNCQFVTDHLSDPLEKYVRQLSFIHAREFQPVHQRIQDMYNLWEEMDETPRKGMAANANINQQGILHMKPLSQTLITNFLDALMTEQETQGRDFIALKHLYFECLIIHLNRIQENQLYPMDQESTWQSEMILASLNQIENHLSEKIDFNNEAQKLRITPSYYRAIFKKVTGLSPLEYLNRVRILRALELLQTTYMSVGEVADAVGIHDQNYFSRLFKKLVGCSPKYYKSI